MSIIGKIFGRLTVLEELSVRSEVTQKPVRKALVRCTCSEVLSVRIIDLKAGNTRSCGCFRREQLIARQTTHGETYEPLFELWMAMRERCKYKENYILNNIKVCSTWEDSYPTFKEYILNNLGEKLPRYSLDRIDNTKGYEPGNVRWASPEDQQRNKRNNTLLTVNGKTQCIAEWADETGNSQATICVRLKRGWTAEKAVLTPSRKYKK